MFKQLSTKQNSTSIRAYENMLGFVCPENWGKFDIEHYDIEHRITRRNLIC